MIGYDIAARVSRLDAITGQNSGAGVQFSQAHAAIDHVHASVSDLAAAFSAAADAADRMHAVRYRHDEASESGNAGADVMSPQEHQLSNDPVDPESGRRDGSRVGARFAVLAAQESGLAIAGNLNDAISPLFDLNEQRSDLVNRGNARSGVMAAILNSDRIARPNLSAFHDLAPAVVPERNYDNQTMSDVLTSAGSYASDGYSTHVQNDLKLSGQRATGDLDGLDSRIDHGGLNADGSIRFNGLFENLIANVHGKESNSGVLAQIVQNGAGSIKWDEAQRAALLGSDKEILGAYRFGSAGNTILDTSSTVPEAGYDPVKYSSNNTITSFGSAKDSDERDVETVRRPHPLDQSKISGIFPADNGVSELLERNIVMGSAIGSYSQAGNAGMDSPAADRSAAGWNAIIAASASPVIEGAKKGVSVPTEQLGSIESGAASDKHETITGVGHSDLAGLWGMLNHAERSLPKVGSTGIGGESNTVVDMIGGAANGSFGLFAGDASHGLETGTANAADSKRAAASGRNGPTGHKSDPFYIVAVSSMARTLMPTVPTPGSTTRSPPIPGQRNLA